MYICIDSSQRFVMLHNGSTLFSSKKDPKSFRNKEKKKKVDKFYPCLTPVCDMKYSESSFPCFTLVFIF